MSSRCASDLVQTTLSEMKTQQRIAIPLAAMNLTWFAKIAITTAFLGRLGELQLAGGALGLTFGNVTGYSFLYGLSSAMEPICGQAFGAKNFKLLHKTLLMAILLLLLSSLPISVIWLNVDKILIFFGQQEEIATVTKKYMFYLIPSLVVTSFLCPLKAYLSSQNITVPTMISATIAIAVHLPMNIVLSKAMGIAGISMAAWISDLVMVIALIVYVLISENGKGGKWDEGGWLEQGLEDWTKMLKLCGPCCLTTCLEWWCVEILVLLTGRLPDPKRSMGVFAIVLNFDYLLYSIMISLATCASIRVSNELGANRADVAYMSARTSLGLSLVFGLIGCLVTLGARGIWGDLFSHDKGIVKGVKKTMGLMALVEVVNFPVTICGGIVRGTARPWLGLWANLAGFYLLALPVAVILGLKVGLGLKGLLIGFMVGMLACFGLLLIFLATIDWRVEANKAQQLTQHVVVEGEEEKKQENKISATNGSLIN
ncbi:protein DETOXIFICATION 56-like [Impatiens glandulifera]|uniref:protein DETOXIFICATION 56-like n=1 Tax=Impatiens glandulifera TaxID=253017 RepID=UPI001FB14503|nr:protein DETOXIFICATION 56-like [Impatiens glandulifera]